MAHEDRIRLRSWRFWAVLFGVATVFGLLNFNIVRTSDLASGKDHPAKYPFLYEMTGAYTVLLLLPIVLPLVARLDVRRSNWRRRVPLHVLISVAFGVSHTLLMWGSRTLLFRLLGWGRYDYGDMSYRFVMEYQKQIIAYATIYGVVHFIRYLRRNRERELRASELERRFAEARLDALKMQLNPHFLFNTLNMISTHVHDDPRLADRMLGRLSDFLRETLRHAGRQEVPLEQDLEFLDDYLAIMQARFGDRLRVRVRVGEDCRAVPVPHLLLQPLVENAVAHCTRDHDRAGAVDIAAERRGASLHLTIEDNGPGLTVPPEEAMRRGIGLSNTAERLQSLYGGSQRLVLENRAEGGLRVRVEVPWRITTRAGEPA